MRYLSNIVLTPLFLLLAVIPAQTEPVLINYANGIGQGWLFRRSPSSPCELVTAAHVIKSGEHPMIIKARSVKGREEGIGTHIRIISPESNDLDKGLDIALMQVEGEIEHNGCTTSILGMGDTRTNRGEIDIVKATGEVVTQEVTFFIRSLDRPWVKVIQTHPGDPRIEAGYSGSAVVTDPTERDKAAGAPLPLAMITREIASDGGSDETKQSRGLAIRFDKIRELIIAADAPLPTKTPEAMDTAKVISWRGETLSSQCPATQATDTHASCGWKARPEGRLPYVQLILQISGTTPTVSGILFNKKPQVNQNATSAGSVEIASARSDSDWIWVRNCASGEECRFNQVTAGFVRLTIPVNYGQEIEVRVDHVTK